MNKAERRQLFKKLLLDNRFKSVQSITEMPYLGYVVATVGSAKYGTIIVNSGGSLEAVESQTREIQYFSPDIKVGDWVFLAYVCTLDKGVFIAVSPKKLVVH